MNSFSLSQATDGGIKNAKIKSTRLGVQCTEHGILSFSIELDYEGSGQSYGGICLDEYSKLLGKRVSTHLASSLLLAIDEIFGVDWEDLKGIPCRALACHSKVYAIGHYFKDKWLYYNYNNNNECFEVVNFRTLKTHLNIQREMQ